MLIDLHLHSTASDGHCTPVELVAQARAAQLTVMAVTDHDTTDAVADVQTAAAAHGIEAIAGIEITAVEDGRDVHVLGYFLDPDGRGLQQFLARQRAHRLERVQDIAARLGALGKPIAVETILADARTYPTRSIGRPQVARAMIAAGYVASIEEAFRLWLGRDGPAFVPRAGASPEVVIATIHTAGGIASLAHPGRTGIDGRLPALAAAGLDALEAFHTDHDDRERARYVQTAGTLGLLVTGGSDFHGDPAWPVAAGSTTLPPEHWARLRAACGRHRG
jgi:predicted metal-dependent phosphoesterase TrpH